MIIEVDKKNRIVVEENCFALQKIKKEKGKERWVSYKWHTDLAALAGDIIQSNMARKKTMVSFGEFLEEYQEEVGQLTSKIKKQVFEPA